jgi:hypothetical protein
MFHSFLGLLTALAKSRKSAKRKQKNLTARLMLESLEERATPSATVFDIPGHGVYLYNYSGGGSGSLTQINTLDAQALAINDGHGGYNVPGEVVADFKGHGLYTWNNGTWTSLHSADATKVDIDNWGNVVGEFPGLPNGEQGVWIRYAGGFWSHITTTDASLLCISQDAVVTGEFPNGVWQYTNHWSQLTPVNASSMDVDLVTGNFVGEFPGQGVFTRSVNGTWSHIDPYDANHVAIGGGIVAVTFTNPFLSGLSLYNEATNTWSRPTTATPSVIAADSWGEVAGEFASGLWNYGRGGPWNRETQASNISLLDIGVSYLLI